MEVGEYKEPREEGRVVIQPRFSAYFIFCKKAYEV